MPLHSALATFRRFRLLGFALLVVVVLGCDSGGGEVPRPSAVRVLFVGNSLTYTNDLPDAVARLGDLYGLTTTVESVTAANYSLEDHWYAGDAASRLEEGEWDVVVMQQGPSTLPASRDHLVEWTGRFAELARAAGARPALYTVWPQKNGAIEATIAHYREAADAAGAELMPAGRAWQLALAQAPALPLYGGDGFHPSSLGTFLAALTIHSTLAGQVPDALPASFDVGTGTVRLDPLRARVLLEAVRGAR